MGCRTDDQDPIAGGGRVWSWSFGGGCHLASGYNQRLTANKALWITDER